jgi:hypothetical protein
MDGDRRVLFYCNSILRLLLLWPETNDHVLHSFREHDGLDRISTAL